MHQMAEHRPFQTTHEERARNFMEFLADTIEAGVRQLGANPASPSFLQLAEDLREQAETRPASLGAHEGHERGLRLVP